MVQTAGRCRRSQPRRSGAHPRAIEYLGCAENPLQLAVGWDAGWALHIGLVLLLERGPFWGPKADRTGDQLFQSHPEHVNLGLSD